MTKRVLLVVLGVLIACGLDEYYVLDEPNVRVYYPTVNTTDELLKKFNFRTSKNSGSGAFVYEGTAVYYKIYNNRSTCSSHIANIDNVNKSDNLDQAAKMIVDTYKYQPLGTSTGVATQVLFPSENDGSLIEIRLHDYHEYKRHISVDGVETGKYPMRYRCDKSFHFDPDSKDKVNVLPEKDDEDVNMGTATQEGTWYVNAYAFSKGRNEQFNDAYSLVLHLGTIIIKEEDFKD